MMDMFQFQKEENVTYFKNKSKTFIDELEIGEIVYLKIKSPLNYGISEWEYYGKIMKKTKCYFEILVYCDAYKNDKWKTEQIQLKENRKDIHTKKWAKKSIVEICKVETEQRNELITYSTNVTRE